MTLAERAKDLFELGFDTQDISEIIKVSEARIYNALSAIRKERYAVKGKYSARDRNKDSESRRQH